MTDAADHPTQSDSLLCRHEIVARLGGALRKESRNILLAGPWGSGKTTLLEGEDFERELEEHVAAGQRRPWKVLTFSPWEETAHQDCAAGFLRFLALEVAKAEAASDVSQPLPERLVAESKYVWQAFLDLGVEAMPYLKDAVAAVPGGTLAFWLARLTAKLYAQRENSRADAEGALPPLQMRVLRGQMRLLLERLQA